VDSKEERVWIIDKHGKWRLVLECVAVLLVNEAEDRLLTVSRGTGETLPGGKVDSTDREQESYLAFAAARELREETGVDVPAEDLTYAFEDFDENDHYTTAFLVKFPGGSIETSESHVIRWSTPKDILAGPFGSYYRKLFKELGR
jgi:ADP-ribose pyrophosphatase YjhB (NUDIX family)